MIRGKKMIIKVKTNGMFGKMTYWEILAYFDTNRGLIGLSGQTKQF